MSKSKKVSKPKAKARAKAASRKAPVPRKGAQIPFHVHRHGGKVKVVVREPLTSAMVGKLVGALLQAQAATA